MSEQLKFKSINQLLGEHFFFPIIREVIVGQVNRLAIYLMIFGPSPTNAGQKKLSFIAYSRLLLRLKPGKKQEKLKLDGK